MTDNKMRETMRDTMREPPADKGVRRVGKLNSAVNPKLHSDNMTQSITSDKTTDNESERQQEGRMAAANIAQAAADSTSDTKTPSTGDGEEPETTSCSNQGYQTVVKESRIRYVTPQSTVVHANVKGPSGVLSKSSGSTGTRRWIRSTKPAHPELERCNQDLEHAQVRIAVLESERDQLEASLRRIQAHAFRRFDAPGWKPDCNADITRKLDNLEAAAKSWAKDNSIANLNAFQTATTSSTFDRLSQTLSEFVRADDTTRLMVVPDSRAWVLTQAYIMHRLYLDIFEEPFFGLTIQLESDSINDTVGNDEQRQESQKGHEKTHTRGITKALQTLYDDFVACNVQEAVAWRVQTLRQLTPSISRDHELFEVAKRAQLDQTRSGRELAAERLVEKCLKSGIRALIKDPEQEHVRSSLRSLILKAAEVAYSLWTQKIYLVVKYIDDQEIGTIFSRDNDMVEPHQLQNKYLDEDPYYWDESRIAIVTHPALVRHGDEDATDFGVRTTLKKATCWMVAEGRP